MSLRTARTRFIARVMIPAVAGLGLAAAGALPAGAAARPANPALHQAARIALGSSGNIFKNIFTEAPNGNIFFSKGSVVYVVVGNTAPKVALHAGGTVLALAANSADLFVQTGLTVTEYKRSDGSAVRHWTLTSPVTPITQAGLISVGSTLWSWTDWGTDSSGFEYARLSRISTGSATVHIVDKQAWPANMAADTSGLYYEDARGAANAGFLVHVTASGASTARKGPVGWPLALSGGKFYQLLFHNNSSHQFVDGYSKTSLARVSSGQVPNADRNINGTSLGLLALAEPCTHLTCATASVSKLAANGSASGTLTVPNAFEFVPGSHAAVIEFSGGHMFLVRIGS